MNAILCVSEIWVQLWHSEFLTLTFLSNSNLFLSKSYKPAVNSSFFPSHSLNIRAINVYLFFNKPKTRTGCWKWVRRERNDTFIPIVFKKGRLLWVGLVEKGFTEERDDGNIVQVKTNRMSKCEMMTMNFLFLFFKKNNLLFPNDL